MTTDNIPDALIQQYTDIGVTHGVLAAKSYLDAFIASYDMSLEKGFLELSNNLDDRRFDFPEIDITEIENCMRSKKPGSKND